MGIVGQLRFRLADAMTQQIGEFSRAVTYLGGVQGLVEALSGRTLPRLAGNPGTAYTPERCRLRATGVITIDVAGWDGLQDVAIDEHSQLLLVWENLVGDVFGGGLDSLKVTCPAQANLVGLAAFQ